MSAMIASILGKLQILTPRARTPTGDDVERYVRLREAGKRLNSEIVDTIPRRAMDDIGKALGILDGGTLIFGYEGMGDVFMDCCLYDWIRGGRNLVRKFAKENPPPEDPDEREALGAMLRARYTVLGIDECVPEAGVRAVDLVADRDVFVLDLGLSRSSGVEGTALAARLLPAGRFWMTSGAALPMTRPVVAALLRNLMRADFSGVKDIREVLDGPQMVLTIIRSCLEGGAADHVRYADPGDADEYDEGGEPFEPAGRTLRMGLGPRRSSRNAQCPCGSGRQYKRCCEKRQGAKRPA